MSHMIIKIIGAIRNSLSTPNTARQSRRRKNKEKNKSSDREKTGLP
jgi:hypothetical protein